MKKLTLLLLLTLSIIGVKAQTTYVLNYNQVTTPGTIELTKKSDGKTTYYRPVLNTDASRGTLLQTIVSGLAAGDALTIGPGSYFITTKLEINDNDVTIKNKGRIYHTNNAIDIFQIDSANNVSISGGILEGAGYAVGSLSAESGIQISGTSRNPSISDMLIRKVRGSGVYMNNLSDSPLADSLRFRGGSVNNVDVDGAYIGYGYNSQYWKVSGGNVSNCYYGQYINNTNSITSGINNSNNQWGAFIDSSGDHGLIANSNFNHNFLGAFYFRNLVLGFDLIGNHIFPRYPTGGDSTIVIDGSKGINFNGGTWGQGSTPFEVHLLGTFTGYNSFRNIGFVGQSPLITGTTPQESHQIWEGNYVIDSLTSGLNRAALPSEGGTGIKNTGTITVSGNTSIGSSINTVTLNTTGNTSVTLPTSGTIATLAGTETLTNKDLTSGTNAFPTFNQNTTGSAASLTTSRTIGTLTGDVTTAGSSFNGTANNTNATVLATVNSNVGTYGSATQSPTYAVNAKGLITSAANVTITPAIGSITGLGTGVSAALVINTGNTGGFVVQGGTLGTPSAGVATNLTGTAAALNIGGNAATATAATTAGTVTTAAQPAITSVGTLTGLTVTAPIAGSITGNAATVTTNANLTGDVTSIGNATTLATVNSNVGSFGSSTSIPSFTINAKGLVTAASGNAVIAPAGTLTGTTLNSSVVTSSLTSLAGFVASGSSRVVQTSTGSYPTLGTWSGGWGVSNSTSSFGLDVGVSNAAGDVWLQAHRRDGTGTAYNIVLNPSGGYAISNTPSANDNSTKVATTAYVDAAVIAVRRGNYSWSSGAVTTFTVSIGATLPNNTYSVVVTPTNTAATTYSYYVQNKTTTTFDIVFNSAINNITMDWVLAR